MDSRSLVVTWDHPTKPNGIIVRYVVYRNNSHRTTVSSNLTMLTVTNLEPFTIYTFSVSICTVIGCSNSSLSRPVRTLEDGKETVLGGSQWLHDITLCASPFLPRDIVSCNFKFFYLVFLMSCSLILSYCLSLSRHLRHFTILHPPISSCLVRSRLIYSNLILSRHIPFRSASFHLVTSHSCLIILHLVLLFTTHPVLICCI